MKKETMHIISTMTIVSRYRLFFQIGECLYIDEVSQLDCVMLRVEELNVERFALEYSELSPILQCMRQCSVPRRGYFCRNRGR